MRQRSHRVGGSEHQRRGQEVEENTESGPGVNRQRRSRQKRDGKIGDCRDGPIDVAEHRSAAG